MAAPASRAQAPEPPRPAPPEPLWQRVLALPAGRRVKWALVVLWLVLTAVTGPFAGKLPGAEKNDAVSYLPASAQSTRVNDDLARFPGGQQVPGIVLYVARHGRITAADRTLAAGQAAAASRQVPGFTAMTGTLSRDGEAISFPFSLAQPDSARLPGDIRRIRSATAGSPAVAAYVTGAAGLLADSVNAFSGIDGLLLLVTGAVVIAALLLIYRSPVLWLVPLVSVIAAIGLSEWAAYQLAVHAGLVVSGENGGILTVLVFGAGTDYALLLVARYREELRRHEDHHDAMRAAMRRAAPAILASASTVILGLLCLLAAELNSESGLGPIGAIGIASALLAQLTFLPALLVVFGRRLFWPARPSFRPEQPQAPAGLWTKIALGISRRPRPVWTTATAALLVLATGLAALSLGLRQTQSFVTTPQSVAGQRLYARHFPAGGSEPVIIIADAAGIRAVLAAVREVPGVTTAEPAGTARGQVQVIAALSSAPGSAESFGAIEAMRSRLARIPGAHALVGGSIATTLDTDNAASADRLIVMPLVLVAVMCILALLLRAIVAPVLLALTVVVSFAAALGVSSLAFRALGFAGVDQTIPLLAFIFLVALGVDYNIFLVSRIREEALTRGTREGTVTAVGATGGVITSAGVVLAATFSVLTVLPLVALVEVGFIVAFGVLLDTLVVRSVLVPALITDVGPAFWWPSALARRDGERRDAPGQR